MPQLAEGMVVVVGPYKVTEVGARRNRLAEPSSLPPSICIDGWLESGPELGVKCRHPAAG